VARATAEGLAWASELWASAPLHPASAQHPASALAASACLAMVTVISASRLVALADANMKRQRWSGPGRLN
jgi:hypothetical protein